MIESFDYARDQARRLSGVWLFVVPNGLWGYGARDKAD